jgi:hypothetical protein
MLLRSDYVTRAPVFKEFTELTMYKTIALFFLLASNEALAFKPTPLARRIISVGQKEVLRSGSEMQMVAGGAERSQDEYYEGKRICSKS